ncbi:protein LKAAEAR1-like [Osmerus eperlanus]|uniref:protein LKAAEAR1-like n=1 Tax=Osmerus eperlanus TaxID=29151 RepID=UPI002E1369D2
MIKSKNVQPTVNATQFREKCTQQRSCYLAQQEQPKEVQGAMTEKERRETTICHLKSADALNRIRGMRLRHQHIRTQEINLMIACQLTAQSALRLELLLPVKETKLCVRDSLNTMERKRVEALLDNSCECLDRR